MFVIVDVFVVLSILYVANFVLSMAQAFLKKQNKTNNYYSRLFASSKCSLFVSKTTRVWENESEAADGQSSVKARSRHIRERHIQNAKSG